MARLRTVFRTDNALDLPGERHRLGGHGGVLRQPGRAGRHRRSSASTACSATACARSRAAAAPTSCASTRSGGSPLDPQRLLDAQREHPHARLVAVVHAETSTGVENDIAPLAALRDTDTLLLVDTVTSLGGIPVEIDGWGVDAAYSGTQKCLGVPPGLSPVTFSPRAVERIADPRPAAAVVVPRRVAHRQLRRRRQPGVPPHRAGLDGDVAPRRARRAARRGPRGGLGPAPCRRAPASRPRCPTSASASSCPTATACPSSPPPGCPTAPTTPTLRKALLTTYGIEVGGGLGEFAGQGVAHRPHGPLRARALGHHAARRAARAARLTASARRRLGRRRAACARGSSAAPRSTPARRPAPGGSRSCPAGPCTRRGTSAGTAP